MLIDVVGVKVPCLHYPQEVTPVEFDINGKIQSTYILSCHHQLQDHFAEPNAAAVSIFLHSR